MLNLQVWNNTRLFKPSFQLYLGIWKCIHEQYCPEVGKVKFYTNKMFWKQFFFQMWLLIEIQAILIPDKTQKMKFLA